MALTTALRINMTGLQPDARNEAKRYQTALDMAAYVDQHGFDIVNMEEHHCADNGWLPSPLTMAAAVSARTQRIRITITALLVTLYDPVRLAEDLAVIDLISNGRLSFVAGSGYRPGEYHAMDKEWAARGRLMDEVIDTLLKAWSGESFEYKGKMIHVTPVPQSRPHPFFFIGGMSAVAARRAARFGLPFYPPIEDPKLLEVYYSELQRHGKKGFAYTPKDGNTMLFVDEHPEQAWQELGPYFLREMQEYSSWKVEGVPRPSEDDVMNIDDVRRSGRFTILTPQQAREHLQEGDKTAVLHPLAGGVPLERAWQSLRLFVEQVLPHAR
ncbi:MAG TPA: LLM class flavin-dependent oxidoreductase [Pseudomonadales bacterium]|nr:LLM class flavin-dependent oxidoreductase [Pseudomonadales bacterium]